MQPLLIGHSDGGGMFRRLSVHRTMNVPCNHDFWYLHWHYFERIPCESRSQSPESLSESRDSFLTRNINICELRFIHQCFYLLVTLQITSAPTETANLCIRLRLIWLNYAFEEEIERKLNFLFISGLWVCLASPLHLWKLFLSSNYIERKRVKKFGISKPNYRQGTENEMEEEDVRQMKPN